MSLAVDRYELGPIGTNCYVVRTERGAAEAVVFDPGARRRALAARARPPRRDVAGIVVTHTHYDHIGAVADLAEATGRARVHLRSRGARARDIRTRTTRESTSAPGRT